MRVLFIDIDTLRPDHMGCYGYSRNTTPNMDKIANDAMVFDNYYCSDAPCLPSRAALVTGMFGIKNGAVGHGGTAADVRLYGEDRDFRDEVCGGNLFNIFRKAGMHTVSISTFAERHSSFWFNAGFNEMYNVGKGGGESGEEVLPVAMDWMERNGEKDDWFMHLHFWDPHTPYRTPADFENPFKDEPFNSWIDKETFDKHKHKTGPHGLNEINMYNDNVDPMFPKHPGKIDKFEDLRVLFDGYDSGIYYTDMLLGQLFDKMDKQGILEDTAIIITSDHGENMGEFGIYGEHATADYPTCRIPMVIKWPNGKAGRQSGMHYNLDLLPTMSDLLNVPYSSHWDGKSYSESIKSGAGCGRDSVVISQMAHVCQRSARFDNWLYIRTYHDGYHLFNKEMLFDVENDPHEINNLSSEYPDICAKGAKIILDWHDEQMASSKYETDPLWTVMREGGPYHTRGMLQSYVERLKNTGREDGAKALMEKYGNLK